MTTRRTRLSLLALVPLGAVTALAAIASSSVAFRLLCGLTSVFVGAIFLIGLPNLFRSAATPLLTVGDLGIELQRIGLVPWSEIDEVGETSVLGQRAVGIWTKDPYYAARQGPWYLWPFALFNRRLKEPPLSFTDNVVPVGELLAALERHWRESGATLQIEKAGAATS